MAIKEKNTNVYIKSSKYVHHWILFEKYSMVYCLRKSIAPDWSLNFTKNIFGLTTSWGFLYYDYLILKMVAMK